MSSGEPTGPSPAQSAPSDSGPPDTAPPPARLPWWGGVLIAAVGLVFVLGMVHEQSTTAALLPPSDGWFSSGQNFKNRSNRDYLKCS